MQGRKTEALLGLHFDSLTKKLGWSAWFPGDGPKPARQGIYRVVLRIGSGGGSYEVRRWAFFSIVDGWHWPEISILGALRAGVMLSHKYRVVRWCGLAGDPNCDPVAEQQPNPG